MAQQFDTKHEMAFHVGFENSQQAIFEQHRFRHMDVPCSDQDFDTQDDMFIVAFVGVVGVDTEGSSYPEWDADSDFLQTQFQDRWKRYSENVFLVYVHALNIYGNPQTYLPITPLGEGIPSFVTGFSGGAGGFAFLELFIEQLVERKYGGVDRWPDTLAFGLFSPSINQSPLLDYGMEAQLRTSIAQLQDDVGINQGGVSMLSASFNFKVFRSERFGPVPPGEPCAPNYATVPWLLGFTMLLSSPIVLWTSPDFPLLCNAIVSHLHLFNNPTWFQQIGELAH